MHVRVCVECGEEYRPEVAQCADCGGDLEDRHLGEGGLPMKNHLGEVVFEPDGDGTLVTWRCRFDSKIPGLGGPLRVIVTRVFRTALDGLARHAFPDRPA